MRDVPLPELTEALSKVVEASKAAARGDIGADSQAAQLELLHEIERQLRTASAAEVGAVQKKLEECLTAALLQGPAQPPRRLISTCFTLLFTRCAV